ncbi:LacI family DNA-binding transcriptional regulator [Streptomyces sp. enrichment culture]|uniref:LacI family DNA-binding transcriptional regulator n=1 Tax=Streptomyces sp. enrichment culture TaxID=1795815 RepID=UPI003F55726A
MTISDVARRARVSPSTASKALNGRAQVNEATRQRVLAAARELAYSPNAFAQNLRTGTSRTVGIIAADGVGRFTLPVLMGASHAFGSEQMAVLLCDSHGDPDLERRNLDMLAKHQADGVIMLGRHTDARPPVAHTARMPIVYAYAPSSDPRDRSVVPDEAGGARQAIEHLIEQGYRRIAHISGPSTSHATRIRLESVRRTLADHGLALAGSRPYVGEWSEQWGLSATIMLLTEDPTVDAVFCGNDQLARGAVEAARELGRRVPDDFGVVGFDDWDALTLGSRPPLSSVDMRLGELGRKAAHRLFGGPADEDHGSVTVPCGLVVRDSSRRRTAP